MGKIIIIIKKRIEKTHVQVQSPYSEKDHYIYIKCTNKDNKIKIKKSGDLFSSHFVQVSVNNQLASRQDSIVDRHCRREIVLYEQKATKQEGMTTVLSVPYMLFRLLGEGSPHILNHAVLDPSTAL